VTLFRADALDRRTADLLDEWAERAAIVEYDGGLSREDAEIVASERLARRAPLPLVRLVEARGRGR
jgi:hypothetical protein